MDLIHFKSSVSHIERIAGNYEWDDKTRMRAELLLRDFRLMLIAAKDRRITDKAKTNLMKRMDNLLSEVANRP